jgi:hypothetical protein
LRYTIEIHSAEIFPLEFFLDNRSRVNYYSSLREK